MWREEGSGKEAWEHQRTAREDVAAATVGICGLSVAWLSHVLQDNASGRGEVCPHPVHDPRLLEHPHTQVILRQKLKLKNSHW